MMKKGIRFQGEFSDRRKTTTVKAKRSSSVDVRSRGSYVPITSRSSSLERPKSFSGVHGSSFTRRSSALQTDGKRALKDSRPLHDKAYQKRCIEELIEFLQHYGYVFSRPFTSPPTKKEYENIFQFLYNYWNDKYKVVKLEEEAPKILMNLGYPFTPNKSVFKCISSQNWAVLLGILIWLMGINKYALNFDDDILLENAENPEQNRILFNYIGQAYQLGTADKEKDEEVFINLLESRFPYNPDELNNEHRECTKTLKHIEEELKRYEKLNEKDAEHKNVIKQYEDFFIKMENHTSKKKESVQLVQDQYDKKAAELLELENQIKEKQAAYDAQGYDGQMHLNYIATQKKELNATLDEKCSDLKKAQAKLWEAEVQFSKLSDKGVADVDQMNELYSSILQSAENVVTLVQDLPVPKAFIKNVKADLSLPRDFKMCAKQQSYNMWLSSMIPAIVEVRKKLDSTLKIVKSHTGNLNKKLQELQLENSELLGLQKLTQAQLKQKESELSSKSQQDEEEIGAMQAQSELLSQQLQSLQNSKTYLLSRKDLIAKQLKLETALSETEREISQYRKESKIVQDEFLKMECNLLKSVEEQNKRIKTKLDLLNKF